MNTKRLIIVVRAAVVALCLAAIVTLCRLVVHANPTTVALTLLLLIFFLAAKWGLRYAIVTSFVAGALYNYFFIPPLYSIAVADPQNLLALIVFLITSIVASRLSNRIREESKDARARQAEVEILYRLSRALLQTDELVQITTAIPAAVSLATDAQAVLFYLLDGDRIYRAGANWASDIGPEHLRSMANTTGTSTSIDDGLSIVPLKVGVRPRGVLLLRGVELSAQSLEALGGLVSVALDRARALEEVTRGEASKESERLRTLMLDSITHELRTPLTSIKASVSTLLTANISVEASHELLSVIDEESDRLNRLVAQALEMSQLDTQEVRMSFSPQSVSELIQGAVEINETTLSGREVKVSIPPRLPKVDADPAWIRKVLGNLLENAAKYSAPAQPIFLSAEERPGMVALSVADRGVGIDPMEQSLIFEKFYRARAQRQMISGTGMGLAICRSIVEAHGGTLSVTSQAGHGSVFTFTLRSE